MSAVTTSLGQQGCSIWGIAGEEGHLNGLILAWRCRTGTREWYEMDQKWKAKEMKPPEDHLTIKTTQDS